MNWDLEIVDLLKQSSDLIVSYSLDALVALVLIVGGFMAGRWAQRSTLRRLNDIEHVDPTIKPLLGRIARLAVLALVVVAVLAQFGVQTNSIIALLGAAGLAIGLAFKDTLSNVASGLLLLFLRPFNVGDWVELGDESGTVTEIGLFLTRLRSADGHLVSVPNSIVANDPMINVSGPQTRRMSFNVGVAYDEDLDRVEALIGEAVEDDERLLTEPAPQVFVSELGDSAVSFTVRAWASQADYWPARFELLKRIKQRLSRESVSIPFPQAEVRLLDGRLKVQSSQPETENAA